MPRMLTEVYDAFRSIGVEEPTARSAATALSKQEEDMADLKTQVRILTWMVGTNIALTLILLSKAMLSHP